MLGNLETLHRNYTILAKSDCTWPKTANRAQYANMHKTGPHVPAVSTSFANFYQVSGAQIKATSAH